MVEFLNEANKESFVKLFNKANKKHSFADISHTNFEKNVLLFKEGTNYVAFLIGYIGEDQIFTKGNNAYITAVYVLPSYRGEGKAYTLVKEFEKWAYEHNVKNIVGYASVKNKKGLDFFEKMSFQNTDALVFCYKTSTIN